MSGHTNFVSAVCVMPPEDKYPQGLIVTGSNDNNIFAYTLDSPQPVFKLTDHTDTGRCNEKIQISDCYMSGLNISGCPTARGK